jgi:class 3 adenylate cyclase
MSDDATINIERDEEEREFVRTGFELLISDPDGHSSRYPVLTGEVTLGGPGERDVDIQLNASELANRQATFHFRQGGLFFTNLESTLPITVNGVTSTFSPLKDGDHLSFLGYIVTVFHLDKKLGTLEGCTDPYRGHLWGVDKEPVTIGRGSGKRPNTVDLNDRTVSRAQATIKHESGAFVLCPDTQNSPIRLNGKPVKEPMKLGNGALIQLGQQLLRFRINTEESQRRDLIPQEATILFSDVWNYSTFAEGRPLEETITQMNEFYSGLGKVIKAHGGVLLTFLGDAMMAVFGADGPTDEDPVDAVKAALAMQTRLGELNEGWEAAGKPTLQVGVGINSGEVMVGDVGFTGKFEFAAMGDNTNLAARVEKLTRKMGCKIIVTASTRKALGDKFTLHELGTTTVKGRETPVQLFGIDGHAS